MDQPKKRGRPPVDGKSFKANPLYKKLCKGLPDFLDHEGNLRVKDLADRIGVSRQVLYRKLGENQLTAKMTKGIIEVSDERMALKDLQGFLPPKIAALMQL